MTRAVAVRPISRSAYIGIAVVGLALGGCDTGSDINPPTGEAPKTDSAGDTQTSSLPPPNRCGGFGLDDVGCPCDGAGQKQLCWPNDPLLRGRGDCSDGQQTCEMVGEFFVWGPCQDYNVGTSCTGECQADEFQSCEEGIEKDHISSSDPGGTGAGGGVSGGSGGSTGGTSGGSGTGGTSGGSGSTVGGGSGGNWTPPQECVIGATRWCDEPVYCAWGKQVCAPDGRWGRCVETTDRPGSCTGNEYNQQCCASANDGCCQDMAHPTIDSAGHIVYATLGTCS